MDYRWTFFLIISNMTLGNLIITVWVCCMSKQGIYFLLPFASLLFDRHNPRQTVYGFLFLSVETVWWCAHLSQLYKGELLQFRKFQKSVVKMSRFNFTSTRFLLLLWFANVCPSWSHICMLSDCQLRCVGAIKVCSKLEEIGTVTLVHLNRHDGSQVP